MSSSALQPRSALAKITAVRSAWNAEGEERAWQRFVVQLQWGQCGIASIPVDEQGLTSGSIGADRIRLPVGSRSCNFATARAQTGHRSRL
mgnify:CR=1 FL=1